MLGWRGKGIEVNVELWWWVALGVPVLGLFYLIFGRAALNGKPSSVDTAESSRLNFGELNSRRGETILLVEDDQQVSNVAALALRGAGYRVLVAADAEEALQQMGKGSCIDLLVTDRQMPGAIQGDQLIRLARQKRNKLPALLVTGYPEGLDLNVPVLVKPYRMSELLSHIYDLLGADPDNHNGSDLKRSLPAR